LVGIAHDTDITVFGANLFDEFILNEVCILEFVHHYMNIPVLITGENFRVLAE